MASNGSSTIFVGSSAQLEGLAASAISAPLLADGDVSFYGHLSGVVNAFNGGTLNKVLSTWAGTGSGLIETTQDTPAAIVAFTVANTTGAALKVPVGQVFTAANGTRYQVVEQPDQAEYWSQGGAGDGTLGAFTIPAGKTVTLVTQALVDGPAGNLLDGQTASTGIAGATATGSVLQAAALQWSVGTVTLHNGSGTDQIIWERTPLTGTHGTYHVGVDRSVSGFVSTDSDGSSGYYVLKAGTSITVPIGSDGVSGATPSATVAAELATAAAANSITGGSLPAGVSISGSSALVTQGIGGPADQDHLTSYGANTGLFSAALYNLWLTGQGYAPTEANVNTANDYVWTAQDLANWQGYVDSARSYGVLNLAPMLSEFETVDFATSNATAYVRAAALYSGGITFDMPPFFFLAREDAYRQSTYDEIRWANQNGLRSSITLSPEGIGDEDFLADTQKMIAMLQANGAMPSQLVVKDEGLLGNSVYYTLTDPNSLNNVAAWLGTLKLTPTNSESGLETRGTTARPDDIMTGVQSAVTVLGPNAVLPFASSQLFATSASTVATLTVSLAGAFLGRLAAGSAGGTVSADGTGFTVTGTMAQLTAALQGVRFTAAAGAQGSVDLVTTVTDAAGTITGHTALAVDNALSMSGLYSGLSTDGPTLPNWGFALSSSNPNASLTATVSLSNPALASFWQGGWIPATATSSADGSTLTITGNAAFIQSYVGGLALVTAPGMSGTETETVSVTDGTQTVSGSTAIAVTATASIAASNIPVTATLSAGGLNEPLANVQITFDAAPGAVIGTSLTLSAGVAHFASFPSFGSVSADGLTYTVYGTAAQIQEALRSLRLSVPAGTQSGAQTLTVNAQGFIHTTQLQLASADTVLVGAPDSTEAGYASATLAAPLLASGNVGLLYDYNGVSAASGSTGALSATWSGTGSGMFGYTLNTQVSQQTITVRNTGSGVLS
ncbi:MAG: hypothetical protein INR65_07165, partial [Gluconacetobacter diazotrophicus]|nr:hypothetical protein [Gluconacetobacter diazotrophicus]